MEMVEKVRAMTDEDKSLLKKRGFCAVCKHGCKDNGLSGICRNCFSFSKWEYKNGIKEGNK